MNGGPVVTGPPFRVPVSGRPPLGTPTAFLVAVASFGGPLALAALYAPTSLDEVASSGGLVTVLAVAAFVAPLAVWFRYGRDIAGPGGLFGFVQAAVGRPVALVQAALWTGSYLLYLLYTSAYVVYDVLPVPWPGVRSWQSTFAVALPIALAALVVIGGRAALRVVAALAAVQVLLVVLLDVVSVRHAPTANAFHGAAFGDLRHATGAVATLFVCGSLPFFLGGDVVRPRVTLPRVLSAAYVLTGVVVLLAVYPLARDPAFTRAAIPGFSVVDVDLGHAPAVALGVGVAGSVVAVMLLEYVALTRLLYAVSGRSVSWWGRALAIPLVIAGPVSLLDPDRFYDDLLRPSLVLLWLAQIVVVAVFPIYTARHGRLRGWHVVAAVVSVAVMGFGLQTTAFGSAAT